jgi:mannose-6-phosphate isomerase-like protein (cupin superfamily)
MKIYVLTCFLLFIVLPNCVLAEERLKTQTSWDGGIIYYPQGQVEQVTKFHCHPVPTLGYILKGDLVVETKDGNKITLKEGESIVEVMRTIHRGRAINGPVEIIVFYAGSTTMPNTVLPENDLDREYCK